ncbi:hypothetical protein BJX99DRAFT_265341 [Aspergillus californicus]
MASTPGISTGLFLAVEVSIVFFTSVIVCVRLSVNLRYVRKKLLLDDVAAIMAPVFLAGTLTVTYIAFQERWLRVSTILTLSISAMCFLVGSSVTTAICSPGTHDVTPEHAARCDEDSWKMAVFQGTVAVIQDVIIVVLPASATAYESQLNHAFSYRRNRNCRQCGIACLQMARFQWSYYRRDSSNAMHVSIPVSTYMNP